MAPEVTLGRDGLLLDGQPFYLLAGCIHYFRWPHAEWRSLLIQARRAGLNTIDTVIPWNRHEPRPGHFDFADEANLAAFLDLCHVLGLKVIVRPGPYICAEWENGGLPAWLTATPGIRLRVDDPQALKAVERWFDRLMEVLVPRQYTRGGPIILCQIENEHWASGVYAHDFHQQTLAAAATARGIEVPQYTCVGAMPGRPELRNGWSGLAEKLLQTRRLWPDNPMMVSELWSGWFDSWSTSRQTRKTAAKLDMTLHQLTAVGAAGFSHWMWAGGTNFGSWGGRTVGGDLVFMTTSYDYDAPVSEYGEWRAKALVARRHHLFLGSLGARLAPILADAVPGGLTVLSPPVVYGRSEPGTEPYRTVRASPDAPEAWRDFQATFLMNAGLEGQTYQVFLAHPARHLTVEVEPATIRPIFAHLPLHDQLRLVCHTGRILGFWRYRERDLLIIYGQPGEQGIVELLDQHSEAPPILTMASPGLQTSLRKDSIQVHYWINETPGMLDLRCGGRPLRLMFLTDAAAARCELLPDGSLQIPSPPAPLQETRLNLSTERFGVVEMITHEGWRNLTRPEPLEHLGCDYGYGWYRATLELDEPLETRLVAPWLHDRARLLVDGVDVGWFGVSQRGPRYTLPLKLEAGPHDVRLLVDNLGRFNYGLKLGELKGLLDTLYLDGEEQDLSHGWSALWQEVQFAGEAVAHAQPGAFRPDQDAVDLRHFAFSGPAVWLLRTLEVQPGRRYLLHITGDRSSGALFVNGEAVERFSRHRSGGFLKHDITDWVRPGANVLALFLQGYAGTPWQATLVSYPLKRPLKARWSFRAGVTPDRPASDSSTGPAFYRVTFARNELPASIVRLGLRLDGFAKGHIWLNGRNLARFWQPGPQEAYKVPVSWLTTQNELWIFVEAGTAGQVTLIAKGQSG